MRLAKLKHFVADTIEPKKKPSALSIIYNIIMCIVVLSSCAFIFVDLFTPEGSFWHNTAHIVEIVAVGFFVFEYVLKLFCSEVLYEGQGWFKSKISYITSFDSFIDILCLLSILVNQIPKEFAALRLLKLIKLTRLAKFKNSIDELRETGEEKEEKKGFRFRVFQIIYKDEEGDKLSKTYDIVSLIIIFLSVGTLILDTFHFNDVFTQGLFIAEVVFTCFFAIDYILRVWTADYEYPQYDKDHAKMRYIFSLMAIIDLLAILPVFFTFSVDAENALPRAVAILKIFKLLKIARLLKASRYLNGIHLFVEAVKEKKKQIFFSIIILVLLVVLSSVLLYSFENMNGNEEFDNGFSGIMYAVSVLTGFGESEMEVSSIGGKIMVVVMMIAGACVVGVPIGIISEEFTKMVAKSAGDEDKDNVDLFKEFSKKLTPEQKMRIIAEYQKEVEGENKESPQEEIKEEKPTE